MKVLIIGDCHTAALKKGQRLLISKGAWPQHVDLTISFLGNGKSFRTPFFVDKGGYAELSDIEYSKQFARFPPAELEHGHVIYGISGPLHTARVRWCPSWTKFVPSQLVIDEAPISNALLHQVIQDDCQYLLKFIDIILRTQKNIFVIEPPKPFKNTVELIRPEVSIHIDSCYRNFIKQELKRRDVPVITVSTECCDKDGYTLDCYRHYNANNDYNGNEEFGEVMMKKVLQFLLDGL